MSSTSCVSLPKRQKSLNGRVPLRRKGRKISSGSIMIANGDRNTKALVPGEVYATHWEYSVYLAMVLPWSPSLAQNCPNMTRALFFQFIAADLPKRLIPECFSIFDPSTLKWVSGYEDGGEHVNERQYPVRWFDKEGFVGWVPGSELVGFDFLKDCEQEEIQGFGDAKREDANTCGYSSYAEMKKRAAVLGATSIPISTKLISEIAADETPIPKFTSRPAVALNAKDQCEIQSSQLTGETPKGAFIIGQGGKCIH
ncbi:hypothetical protein MGG_16014 [Pyricularia oryzae 70-15]|uniref:Uncharacterized protein n=1 Tax=Pyricularia oryzae (strain 70-15 / ATCC MYA-4617 / FGSC 8958) TaxID=242507 RepID=G4MMV7_PYRO7|nr:uncharacterized protein MGG_16014 [Pyricularia oryzae 70-15]EHA56187.1 hypothetical protein MGG_16014 [Pyricularia oryzae 70-15]